MAWSETLVMTDALTHDAFLPEAASEAAPVAATDAASVAARVAAPTLGPAKRIEVMLSSDRRREHPPELRARLVAEMMTGRTPVSVIARREGVCASVLHRWQRRARMLTGLPVPSAPPRLLPVRVEAPTSEAPRVAAGLEVVLGNGRVLRVPVGADPAQVAQMAAALEG